MLTANQYFPANDYSNRILQDYNRYLSTIYARINILNLLLESQHNFESMSVNDAQIQLEQSCQTKFQYINDARIEDLTRQLTEQIATLENKLTIYEQSIRTRIDQCNETQRLFLTAAAASGNSDNKNHLVLVNSTSPRRQEQIIVDSGQATTVQPLTFAGPSTYEQLRALQHKAANYRTALNILRQILTYNRKNYHLILLSLK